MLCRIIFCCAVCLAILAVILLALVSPLPSSTTNPSSWTMALSLYVQYPHLQHHNNPTSEFTSPDSDAEAFIFRRTLTDGPDNTSKIVGKAQGFIIPFEKFAKSAFNIIYLTFETPHYSGSLSVEAKQHEADKEIEELTVVGGTGSFAFARGIAIFHVQTPAAPNNGYDHDERQPNHNDRDGSYHVKLQLTFPKPSPTHIP